MKRFSCKKLAFLGSAILLASCVSYPDSRPPEERKAQLDSAARDVLGSYEVVDSRKDDFRGTTQVAIDETAGGLSVTLRKQNGKALKIEGTKCSGHYSAKNGFTSATCDVKDGSGVYYFTISQKKSGDIVKDGALLLPFEPMPVPGDGYLLDVGRHGGRSNYYVLKKQ